MIIFTWATGICFWIGCWAREFTSFPKVVTPAEMIEKLAGELSRRGKRRSSTLSAARRPSMSWLCRMRPRDRGATGTAGHALEQIVIPSGGTHAGLAAGMAIEGHDPMKIERTLS